MRPRALLACLGASLLWLAATAPAGGSPRQEMILQDDPSIVYPKPPESLDATLGRIAALGVDRIRIHVDWRLVAPRPESPGRPSFGELGPRDPRSYPAENWHRYDEIMKKAEQHGLGVLASVVGPAPAWATARRSGVSSVRPSPSDFRDFVEAVGRRYSGDFPDPHAPPPQTEPEPPPDPELPASVGGEQANAAADAEQPATLPRIDHWSIWNEPNYPSWLMPQWRELAFTNFRPVSPHLYRRLVDAAWGGLRASGHRRDVILLGETAPYGDTSRRRPGVDGLVGPARFVRELYCLDDRYRYYRGKRARVRGCPRGGRGRRRFRRAHPGLFATAGWAHHAYSLEQRPNWLPRKPEGTPIGALGRLTRTLDRTRLRWGARRRLPVWITEYGYQTKPPDPYRGVSWRRQAHWMTWAEYIAFRNRRVAAFSQFLLTDDLPRDGYRRGDPRRWVTWQSGLETAQGRRKPAYREFSRGIHVTPKRTRRRRGVRIFSVLRRPRAGTVLRASVEFRPRGGGRRTLRRFTVRNPRGYLFARVRPRRSGYLRVVWREPDGRRTVTRRVGVRVRR